MRAPWIIALVYVQLLDLLSTLAFLPFGYELNPFMVYLMGRLSPFAAMLLTKSLAVAVCLWIWRRSAYRPAVMGVAVAISSLAPLWNVAGAALSALMKSRG